jgi:hypothetical protein
MFSEGQLRPEYQDGYQHTASTVAKAADWKRAASLSTTPVQLFWFVEFLFISVDQQREYAILVQTGCVLVIKVFTDDSSLDCIIDPERRII